MVILAPLLIKFQNSSWLEVCHRILFEPSIPGYCLHAVDYFPSEWGARIVPSVDFRDLLQPRCKRRRSQLFP